MRLVFGFEESQTCTIIARALGHEAYSCDILPCSGGHPEWHHQRDIFEVIAMGGWEGGVFFPPCTHLAVSGAKHFQKKRDDGRQREGIELFLRALYAARDIPEIGTENPIGIMTSDYIATHFPDLLPLAESVGFPRKPDQIVQPWMFGDPFTKSTCLWLKGLPLLKPTNITDRGGRHVTKSGKSLPEWYNLPPGPDRARIRSKTFPGLAQAMISQWWGGDSKPETGKQLSLLDLI